MLTLVVAPATFASRILICVEIVCFCVFWVVSCVFVVADVVVGVSLAVAVDGYSVVVVVDVVVVERLRTLP